LGQPLTNPDVTLSSLLAQDTVTITDYNIQVYNGQAILLHKTESSVPREPTLDIPVRQGTPIQWQDVFDVYPGKYTAGSSALYLTQPNGVEVVGTVAISPLDSTLLTVSWDTDTIPSDTLIDSQGRLDNHPDYGDGIQHRSGSPGTFDAIVNPLTYNPENPDAGTRLLIVEDIGNENNSVPAAAWGTLVAVANDIIEWTGTEWNVVFNSVQETSTMVWQTNIYKSQANFRVQYVWNGVQWAKSFEGEYRVGEWRLEL
jgi:hypothetical protein